MDEEPEWIVGKLRGAPFMPLPPLFASLRLKRRPGGRR